MQLLLIFYILIAIVCGVFLIGMFFPKNNKVLNTISTVLSIIVAVCLGILTFSSLPSNYIFRKIISIIFAILPLVPVGLLFAKVIKYPLFKILVAGALILNFAYSLI